MGTILKNGEFVVMRITVFICKPRWNDIFHTCSLCPEHVSVLNTVGKCNTVVSFCVSQRNRYSKIQYKRWKKSCPCIGNWMQLASFEVIRTGDRNWLGRLWAAKSFVEERNARREYIYISHAAGLGLCFSDLGNHTFHFFFFSIFWILAIAHVCFPDYTFSFFFSEAIPLEFVLKLLMRLRILGGYPTVPQ